MINAFEYFPTIIYRDEHPEWIENILNISQKYFNEFLNEKYFLQTKPLNGEPNIKFLEEYLLQTGKDILLNQGYDLQKYNLYLSGVWGQEIKKNGGTDTHVHKNSQLCGWLFLKTPIDGSYPIFYDTRMNKEMIQLDYNQGPNIVNATSSIHFNNVIPGTILFANSWMKHQLSVNNSNESTKAIHFIISHNEKTWNIH